ncbi:MAG: hypothetical protein GTN36_04305 [Candidatus Aenigmarchaeota archaeon]|nr:hypothetical protein [Candidatus Aenigmarchaeota archaeon]
MAVKVYGQTKKYSVRDPTRKLEMLIPCGIVGGEIRNYPKADFILKRVLKVETADNLAEIMASVSLAGNLAALSMLSTIGLEEGHQPHRR